MKPIVSDEEIDGIVRRVAVECGGMTPEEAATIHACGDDMMFTSELIALVRRRLAERLRERGDEWFKAGHSDAAEWAARIVESDD